jgi:hypothetical protein
MTIGIGSVITFLVSWLKGNSLTKSLILVAFFVALKALLITLLTVTLAIVLHNFVLDFVLEWIQSAVANLPSGSFSSAIYQLTGVGGWFGSQLRIPECASVIISASTMVGIRRMIPLL